MSLVWTVFSAMSSLLQRVQGDVGTGQPAAGQRVVAHVGAADLIGSELLGPNRRGGDVLGLYLAVDDVGAEYQCRRHKPPHRRGSGPGHKVEITFA